MPFLAVGVEHRTAPLEIRERLALDAEGVAHADRQLAELDLVDEVVVLSTCNRTEVYLFVDALEDAAEAVRSALADDDVTLREHLQTWREMDAAEHLFRVASGLESQIPGEAQITSQVSEALQSAQDAGTTGPNLHSLFRTAVSCARRARAGTALGRVNLSVGSEAVQAAHAELGGLQGRSALVIGGGEVSRLIAGELRHRAVDRLYVANRTVSVAVELAAQVGGTPAQLGDIARLAPIVDVIFSATSAGRYVVTPEDLADLANKRTLPLHVFDLAIPRDVDPGVASLPGIVLHDLDDLLPTGMGEAWSEDVRAIEAVIAAEIQEFTAWYLTRRVAPVIANLRSHVEAVQRQELKRIAPHLADLTPRERTAVESMTQRLIDKMFHHLVMRLRLAAQTDPTLVDAAEFFFLHGEGGLFEHAADAENEAEITR
ncbi:MAG TPA: glutamyl-tRNA reductase [Chloroflexota bacterium]